MGALVVFKVGIDSVAVVVVSFVVVVEMIVVVGLAVVVVEIVVVGLTVVVVVGFAVVVVVGFAVVVVVGTSVVEVSAVVLSSPSADTTVVVVVVVEMETSIGTELSGTSGRCPQAVTAVRDIHKHKIIAQIRRIHILLYFGLSTCIHGKWMDSVTK